MALVFNFHDQSSQLGVYHSKSNLISMASMSPSKMHIKTTQPDTGNYHSTRSSYTNCTSHLSSPVQTRPGSFDNATAFLRSDIIPGGPLAITLIGPATVLETKLPRIGARFGCAVSEFLICWTINGWSSSFGDGCPQQEFSTVLSENPLSIRLALVDSDDVPSLESSSRVMKMRIRNEGKISAASRKVSSSVLIHCISAFRRITQTNSVNPFLQHNWLLAASDINTGRINVIPVPPATQKRLMSSVLIRSVSAIDCPYGPERRISVVLPPSSDDPDSVWVSRAIPARSLVRPFFALMMYECDWPCPCGFCTGTLLGVIGCDCQTLSSGKHK